MKDYIQIGIEKGLISLNEDKSRIKYIWQKKERNYNDPEEKVQALAFLKLILDYNYPVYLIRLFVPVTMGSEVKEADIVVYGDELCLSPLILVECKKQEVSEAEFQQAINQAYSYAFALPGEVKYVWVTSGIKDEYYEVDKTKNTRIQIPDIPQYGVQEIANYKYVYGALASFIVDSCSGDWGSDGEVDIVPSGWTKCVVLRGTEIDNMYNLSICQEKVKKRLIQTDKFKKIQPILNDIIIEKSGGSNDQPVGRVAIVDLENFNNIPLSFSNFLMKIRVKGIDANYLYYYLKTIYNIGGTDSMQSQTNGIKNLIIKEYLEQKVVVPSLEKQQEISNHIAEMRLMAKRLQEEGESILENAKKEVEQMILG